MTLDLTDILDYKGEWNTIYSDSHFCRRRAVLRRPAVEATIMDDRLPAFGASVVQVSIAADDMLKAHLQLPDHQVQPLATGAGQGLVPASSDESTFWFPVTGFYRTYSDAGHVQQQETLNSQWKPVERGGRLELTLRRDRHTEFIFIQFDNGSEFIKETAAFSPVEQRHVHTSLYFRYRSLLDLFSYVARGQIRHLLFPHPSQSTGCPTEQTANSFYQYTDYLHQVTGKMIYALVRDWAAMSVMLSLPADGRWRHGHWTDQLETHMRHQLDGIVLFLDYYRNTGRSVFLDRAKLAMNYVLSCSNALTGGGRWYLHDSLETSESLRQLHYTRYTPIRAFGKTSASTLCLNTHLWTLMVLRRLADATHSPEYSAFYNDGMQALNRVLSARPAFVIYTLVYGIRDGVRQFELLSNHPWISRYARKYDSLLRNRVVVRMKARWPRLFMPNGYIERDLDNSCLSDFYHLQTLRDLALLAAATGSPSLQRQVMKSLRYTCFTRFCPWYFKFRDVRMDLLAEVFFLAAATMDKKWLAPLTRFLRYCRSQQVPLPADLLAHPDIANRRPLIQTDSSELLILHPQCTRLFEAVVLNPTECKQVFQFRWTEPSLGTDYIILSSGGVRLDSRPPISVNRMDYLLVRRRDFAPETR